VGAPSTTHGEDRRLSVKARANKSCTLSLDLEIVLYVKGSWALSRDEMEKNRVLKRPELEGAACNCYPV
jgi:hypothetical protein